MVEFWRDIPEYEGLYQASTLGRIRSKDRTAVNSKGFVRSYKSIVLKPALTKQGRSRCVLRKNGKSFNMLVHRAIAITFIDNPNNKPEVNHKDTNPLNNVVENLEWSTKGENMKHSYANGIHNQKGESHNHAKLKEEDIIEIRRMRLNGSLLKEIAHKFDVSTAHICNITKGNYWSHF